MNSSEPMSRDMLLELAALDAFGLLDEYESALYTRSVHHATPAVQDEVLALQAELVSDENLLPKEEPSPDLRRRVLRAVNQAIEADDRRLQPIARIGRRRDARNTPISERLKLSMAGQFWRAAAFVFAAVAVVLAYFGNQTYQQNQLITQTALNIQLGNDISTVLGTDLWDDYIANETAQVVTLRPTSAQYEATVWAVIREDADGESHVALFSHGLPQDQTFTLRLRDTASDRVYGQFAYEQARGLSGIEIDRAPDRDLLASAQWELVDDTGTVLYRSA
ncbi:MAG: hypothetical protein AAF432_12555 [Planctomycetota bacterium]